MSQFSYIKQADVSEETTAEYQFRHLVGRPILVCAPGTKENKPMLMEALAEPSRPDRKMSPSELMEERRVNRLRSARRFAKHCVRDWRDVVNTEGKPVPFSLEAVTEFLETVAADASWMFDEFTLWLSEASNFVQAQFDAEGTAKNSVPG